MSQVVNVTEIRNEQPSVVIEPPRGWQSFGLRDLWTYRELLYFLTWRDIKVRYKQTALGAAWAIIQPVMTMVIFSIIFGSLAKLPSDGVPYPIFTYTALLPWQLFAFALNQSSTSLVTSNHLVKKVYFPRLIIPLASTLPGLIDFFISFLVLIGLMMFYQIPMTVRLLSLPVFLLLALMSALAVGLWLSALNVQYRDVRHAVPFLTMVWQYSTPIAYSTTLIPEKWRLLYALNPMTGVVEGFRWALLGKEGNVGDLIWISIAIVGILFFSGLIYFSRMENTFADVI